MKKTAWVSLFIILATHILLIFLPPARLDVYLTFFRPTLFAVLALMFMVFFREKQRVVPTRTMLTLVAVFGVVILVAVLFLLGVIFGFGFNPMSTTFVLFWKNIWCYVVMAVLREYLRGKIMRILGGRPVVIVAVTLIFAFSFVDNIRTIVAYEAIPLINAGLDTLIPVLILNFFLTYMAVTDGDIGNMIFMGIYQVLYFLSPVLPSIPKILEAMVICLCVFVMYVFFDDIQWKTAKGVRDRSNYPWRRLAMTASLGALVIMFVFGVFRYFPLVVVSNSMKGTFSRGDVVIIRKIDIEAATTALSAGDIVNYMSEEGIAVVHRVVEVLGSESTRMYVTKGDNNAVPDIKPVRPEQIEGIVKSFVPYIGYPTLLLTTR